MRLWPESIEESDINLRWAVAKHLEVIEEVVCGPQVSEADTPGMEETWERARQAARRGDREAEDEALAERSWAEIRNWWQDFPERDLLARLYQRAARRRARSGSPNSRRLPSLCEGLQVARAMLADIPSPSPLDLEQETAAIAQILAAKLLPPIGRPTRQAVRYYKDRSESIPAYFDALTLLCEELDKQDKCVRGVLDRWRQEVADGHRPRPATKPIEAHRPANPEQVNRDVHIQFTIEVLRRVGVWPRGRLVSGCGIVSEVLGLSEATVGRIWNECRWRGSLLPAMQKYSKAIARRTGLHSTST